jgi:predicted transcriptional regulator of viral defense system
MIFQKFYKTWFEQACFTSNQVYAWRSGFDKNNLGRWVKNGFLVKLRNGHYTFPEYLNEPNFSLFVANRLYLPSYVSLHTALAFYELIPESVVQISNVTTLKTANFKNQFGTFTYKTIKPECFFGYDILPFSKERSILMAKPEKALLDLLYLYTFYQTEDDVKELRLDEDVLHEIVKSDLLLFYLSKFNNKALEKRVKILMKTYNL